MNIYNAFTFSTVPNIVCETGAAEKLGTLDRQQFPDVKNAPGRCVDNLRGGVVRHFICYVQAIE